MRDRLDFSSISAIILENRKADSLSNTDYYMTLFDYAFTQNDIKIVPPDDAIISRTIRGQRNVVKDIISIYQQPENQEFLQDAISNILEDIADPAYIQEQLEYLLWNDNTISEMKKRELSKGKESLKQFLFDCLIFGFNRNFISREEKGDKEKKKKSFILSDYLLDYRFPSLNKVFYGREQDLIVIRKRMCETSCLFLEGIGGIGKSELAKQYGKRYKNDYEHVIFLRYQESLHKTITELEFVDDRIGQTDGNLFRNHYRFFKQLSSDTLVILDSFDTVPEQEELFHDFLSISFQLLITTRSHIEDVISYSVREIDEINELMELFYTYAPNSRNEPSVVQNIIEEVYCHTLTVEMSAKTLIASSLNPYELLTALRKERIALSNPNKIKVTKDSKTKKERLHRHIQTLFLLQNLSPNNRYMLLHMGLVPRGGISKGLFHNWLMTENYNPINELIEYGWVQEDIENNRISLHPFLHEVIIDFDKPSFRKCAVFLTSVFTHCHRFGEDISFYHEVLNTVESILLNITMDDTFSAYLFIDKAIAYFEKYDKFDKMEWLLEVMKECIPMDETHQREHGTYLLYKGQLEYNRMKFTSAIEYMQRGLKLLEPLQAEYAELATNLYCSLGNVYMMLQEVKLQLKCAEMAISLRQKYQLLRNHDALIQEGNLAVAYILNGEHRKADDILKPLLGHMHQIPDFDVTLGGLYGNLGAVEIGHSPNKAKEYLKKAKEHLLKHFPPNHPQVLVLDAFNQEAKQALMVKKLKRIHQKPFPPR